MARIFISRFGLDHGPRGIAVELPPRPCRLRPQGVQIHAADEPLRPATFHWPFVQRVLAEYDDRWFLLTSWPRSGRGNDEPLWTGLRRLRLRDHVSVEPAAARRLVCFCDEQRPRVQNRFPAKNRSAARGIDMPFHPASPPFAARAAGSPVVLSRHGTTHPNSRSKPMSTGLELSAAERALFEILNATGEGAPRDAEKLGAIERFRAISPEHARRLDQLLVLHIKRLVETAGEVRRGLAEMKRLLERATAPPLRVAVFLDALDTPDGPRALVHTGGARQVVPLGEAIDLGSIRRGDEVFLSAEAGALVGKLDRPGTTGETASFDRRLDDGRLVVSWRDAELVLESSGRLQAETLERGDQVRIDRDAGIVLERVAREDRHCIAAADVPATPANRVGGLGEVVERLRGELTARLRDRAKADQYRVASRRAILLVGPPGCGKTLLARSLASEMLGRNGAACKFTVVKPGEWENPYVGMTQRNMRATFDAMRRAARETHAVLFIDELEATGRLRGSMVGFHSDKFLAALLVELDGFIGREGVAVIGATNRADLCDPAILDRFDVTLVVPRPDMEAAREIFRIHLPPELPFASNGSAAADTREELIGRAVARLYAPNADNTLCTIRFRNGRRRAVVARELMSGRLIEQICAEARQRAFLRDLRTGRAGVGIDDMDEAVSAAIERLRRTLTRFNVHAHLTDLPQDVDVVAVEPVGRRADHPPRYLRVEDN